jgi:hypothetical protein
LKNVPYSCRVHRQFRCTPQSRIDAALCGTA